MEYNGQMIYGDELLKGILPESIVEGGGAHISYDGDPRVPVPGTTWWRERYT